MHREPYRGGWLLRIRPKDTRFRWALRGNAVREWLGDENARLARLLEQELGVAAADGGELVVPPSAWLSDSQWRVLTRAFLRTTERRAPVVLLRPVPGVQVLTMEIPGMSTVKT